MIGVPLVAGAIDPFWLGSPLSALDGLNFDDDANEFSDIVFFNGISGIVGETGVLGGEVFCCSCSVAVVIWLSNDLISDWTPGECCSPYLRLETPIL